MAACFVSAHSLIDTPHFSGDTVHGARNCNVTMPRSPFARFLTLLEVKFYVFKRQKRGEGNSKSKNNF